MSMVVFQSRYLGYAVWVDKPDKKDSKKIKFQRGLYQTDSKEEIELLSKNKNVVRLTPVHRHDESPAPVKKEEEIQAKINKKSESSVSKSNLLLADEPLAKKDK